MTNTIKHFKCGDTEYPLAFTMNVIEKIQDKYEVEVIDQKMYDTKYHGFQYSFALIQK